ncbi:hypothetical protein CUJ83_06450 [Methanocella sp. CWC-04]|uniref:Uncharacterized protein n=2 Tax=Methanooceanicella nereidis TaxID=2052831 RepID=A0AAP2RCB0_9EURY|nr:hypothetical protein [Methanocella sp. CWC-04]
MAALVLLSLLAIYACPVWLDQDPCKSGNCKCVPIFLIAQRLDNESLKVWVADSSHKICQLSDEPFIMKMSKDGSNDFIEFSNMSDIKSKGYNVTITPEEGLFAAKDSSAVIKGEDIRGIIHIACIGSYKNAGNVCVLEATISMD